MSIGWFVVESRTNNRIHGGGVIGLRSYKCLVYKAVESEPDAAEIPCRQSHTCVLLQAAGQPQA
jgi:hypothetical protein